MRKIGLFAILIATHLHGDLIPMQIVESPRLFMLAGFLSDKECDHIINLARSHLVASKVVDDVNTGEMFDKRRTSSGFCLHHHEKYDPILRNIEKKIAVIAKMPIENGEDFQVLHYEVGGEYQPHYDYFNQKAPGGAECMLHGGQRVMSWVLYLNTPESGGETIFPNPNVRITPRKGDAIFFYNCTPDGKEDPNSLHGGMPVIAGEKWIMTKWFREKKFQ